MEIILSSNCKSFTGTIDASLGYYIRSTKNGRFFSQRSKHPAPPDGHWRFILDCAELAQDGLIVADIKVDWMELYDALFEACHFDASDQVRINYGVGIKFSYNADDIINLKTTFGL
jgi:hypothetical protein